MPKLAAKDRKKVGKAEAVTGGFEPLAPAKYIATLSKVEARLSAAGNPTWNAEFEDVTSLDGEVQPGRQWMNINLPIDTMPEGYNANGKAEAGSAKATEKWNQYQALTAGRLKAFFEAFGYSEDSDTDEMLGEKCILQIGIQTIQKGPRTGQQGNNVNGIFPLSSIEGADSVAAAGGGDDPNNF